MRKIWGGVLVLTGIIACPCHLPLTLAVLAGVLGGTALGGFIANHQGLIFGIAAGYFVISIAAGWYLLSRKRAGEGVVCDVEPIGRRQKSGQRVTANTTQKQA